MKVLSKEIKIDSFIIIEMVQIESPMN